MVLRPLSHKQRADAASLYTRSIHQHSHHSSIIKRNLVQQQYNTRVKVHPSRHKFRITCHMYITEPINFHVKYFLITRIK
jgi:hypothetical protein